MPYVRNNMGGYSIVPIRTIYDGHGGHSEEHRQEIESIAAEVADNRIEEKIPAIAEAAYNRAQSDFMNALEMDIESAVTVSLQGVGDIFYDRKAHKAIASALTKEVKKQLRGNGYHVR